MPIHTTANHPWLTVDRGFVAAGELRQGEALVTLGGSATGVVVWVRGTPGVADRYNLTVAHDHTYAVGAGLWVVHNTCGGNASPTKGSNGVDAANEALQAQGYPQLTKEVQFRTPGGSPRLDLAGVQDDTLIAVESKNGPTAKLTGVQRRSYPYFFNEDVGNIVPIGPNARLAGLTPGMSLQAQGISHIQFVYWRFDI